MKTWKKIHTVFKNDYLIFRTRFSYNFTCSTDINYTYSNFISISHIVNFNNQTLNFILLSIDLLLAISDIYIFQRWLYEGYDVKYFHSWLFIRAFLIHVFRLFCLKKAIYFNKDEYFKRRWVGWWWRWCFSFLSFVLLRYRIFPLTDPFEDFKSI